MLLVLHKVVFIKNIRKGICKYNLVYNLLI